MGKKINQLSALTDDQANENNRVLALADPASGIAGKVTIEQMKMVCSTQYYKYTATGSEGSTLTIAELDGKEIIAIFRESGPLYEVASSPNSSEFTWDTTDIGLGAPVGGAGERFLIIYKNY